ncbi:acyl-CoA thioesterase [Reinekea blandensis]|uniref:Acyl-CoA thioesterase II, putative n=1 Tax=Reinekea blandensis MED297 TaxID=314283 RepID=A4B9P9_9GAMM|nr:thioesterase family protein [Reinekea blandensis]EAR11350.1 acyl-CoA thioesterase II, putative [Reinekea sp. MED297] [Reinekea blandensis MED297]
MTQIDELLSVARQGRELVIPESWGQGRTVFGGLSGALMLQAMTSELLDARDLRVMTTQFIGPLNTDEPFTIEVEHLRDGKNVTQMQARLCQCGQVSVQAMAAFGQERASKINVRQPPAERAPVPEKANWVPQIPKVTPKFHRYIDLKIDEGGMPFTGRKTSHYRGWMRLSEAPATFTDAHLMALIDVWPPTVLQLLRWPAPASTLSWNVEFVHPHPPIRGTDWIGYDVDTVQAADGYGHTEAKIYAQDGTLLALSRQLVTVFG